MQKSNTKLDFANNIVNMFGKDIQLHFTNSGHYCIPLSKPKPTLFSLPEYATSKEKMKVATKLHKNYSHAHYEKVQKALKEAGVTDKELLKMIKTVQFSCRICHHQNP